MVRVKASAASARQTFHGCEPGYIADVCHGRCCRSATAPGGTLITIHPNEEAAIAAAGGHTTGGRLDPVDGRCPFQAGDTYLCGLHGTVAKPFGCIASPFTLNANGTLIIRNRYRLLRCYKDARPDGTQLPAYVAFRASLDLLFGGPEAARICEHLAGGGGDLWAEMLSDSYGMVVDNDAAKRH